MSSWFSDEKEIDIPDVFKTSIREENFTSCISCGKDLVKSNEEYYIEKIFIENKVEVEYAICKDCVDEMRKSFSEESIRKINDYFSENLDIFSARYHLLSSKSTNVNDYISNCIFKNQNINHIKEYQIIARCRGNKLLLSLFPYMVCHDVIEEVQELLSAKTKEELDRFTDMHFGLPPDIVEIIKDKNLIII